MNDVQNTRECVLQYTAEEITHKKVDKIDTWYKHYGDEQNPIKIRL